MGKTPHFAPFFAAAQGNWFASAQFYAPKVASCSLQLWCPKWGAFTRSTDGISHSCRITGYDIMSSSKTCWTHIVCTRTSDSANLFRTCTEDVSSGRFVIKRTRQVRPCQTRKKTRVTQSLHVIPVSSARLLISLAYIDWMAGLLHSGASVCSKQKPQKGSFLMHLHAKFSAPRKGLFLRSPLWNVLIVKMSSRDCQGPLGPMDDTNCLNLCIRRNHIYCYNFSKLALHLRSPSWHGSACKT